MKWMMLPLILLPLVVHADDQWFERQAEGWFWYIDPPQEEEIPEEPIAQSAPATINNPKAELEAFQTQLENAQAQAVMQPTRENVLAYLYLQKAAMDRSQAFAETWKRVVWTTPELDHTLIRPTSPKAVHAYYDTRNETREQDLRKLAQSHGLLYFFRQSCPYCTRFSPILKNFAQRYGFHVTAVTLDGGTSPGFPNPRPDNGSAARLKVQAVPAVYLVNPTRRTVEPLAFGLLGPSELEERLISIINRPPGESP